MASARSGPEYAELNAVVRNHWNRACNDDHMSTEITRMEYHYVILDDEPSAAAAALATLAHEGVHLVGFSEFPHGPGKTQLDLIALDSRALARTATDMGLTVSRVKTGFMIQGDGLPAPVVADVLQTLAAANIRVTSMQAVAAGDGRFGAMLWVKSTDVDEATKVLAATVPASDLVDETSEESFPASDAPAWAMTGPG
jgi:hypothetical protein